MNSNQHIAYRRLKDAGFQVQKHNQIRFNSGSETAKHAIAKTLVAFVGQEHGYRVASEVETHSGHEIDVLLWGKEARITYAVECETSPSPPVIAKKQRHYVRAPVEDMIVINVTDMPINYREAIEYIRGELGL